MSIIKTFSSVKYSKTHKALLLLQFCMKYTALGESPVANIAHWLYPMPYLPLNSLQDICFIQIALIKNNEKFTIMSACYQMWQNNYSSIGVYM